MAVALGVQNYSRIDTMLHITAAQYTREQTIQHLQTAYSNGIRNFLALRGDLPPDVRMTDYWIIWKSFRETQTRTISERWTWFAGSRRPSTTRWPSAVPVSSRCTVLWPLFSKGWGERAFCTWGDKEFPEPHDPDGTVINLACCFYCPIDMGALFKDTLLEKWLHFRLSDRAPRSRELPAGPDLPQGQGRRRCPLHHHPALLRKWDIHPVRPWLSCHRNCRTHHPWNPSHHELRADEEIGIALAVGNPPIDSWRLGADSTRRRCRHGLWSGEDHQDVRRAARLGNSPGNSHVHNEQRSNHPVDPRGIGIVDEESRAHPPMGSTWSPPPQEMGRVRQANLLELPSDELHLQNTGRSFKERKRGYELFRTGTSTPTAAGATARRPALPVMTTTYSKISNGRPPIRWKQCSGLPSPWLT